MTWERFPHFSAFGCAYLVGGRVGMRVVDPKNENGPVLLLVCFHDCLAKLAVEHTVGLQCLET